MPSPGRGWQRRKRSNIEILRVNLMTPAEAATGRKRARKIKLLYLSKHESPNILASQDFPTCRLRESPLLYATRAVNQAIFFIHSRILRWVSDSSDISLVDYAKLAMMSPAIINRLVFVFIDLSLSLSAICFVAVFPSAHSYRLMLLYLFP